LLVRGTLSPSVRCHGGILVLASALGLMPARAQQQAASVQRVESVLVQGFKSSLERALDVKRESATVSDSIEAEDIAKFPDLNLSESIQRIPGVAISRDAGEGRQITVRGLGGSFTKTLINGMEALATTSGAGIGTDAGTNRTDAFDFNVFAADLFSNITVQKSASAQTEDGSLGTTVELRTAHPFDYRGFTLVGSAKAGYNDLAASAGPRLSALVSDTYLGGSLGVLVSVAYSRRSILDVGASTVRWTGGLSPVGDGFAAVTAPALSLADVNSISAGTLFHPRNPRFDKYVHRQYRLGATGSIQWQPDDATLFTLDALYSDFGGTRDQTFNESFTFMQAGPCPSLTLPADCGINQTIIRAATVTTPRPGIRVLNAGTFDNVDLRSEHLRDKLGTKYQQFTLNGARAFGDKFRISGTLGYANSAFGSPIETDVFFEQDNVQGYSYDYAAGLPLITYGTGKITDPDSWHLVEIQESPNWVYNTYLQGHGEAEWKATEWLALKSGYNWVQYRNRAITMSRSNGTNSFVTTVVPPGYSRTVAGISQLQSFSVPGLPPGNATQWLVPDLDAGVASLHLYDTTFMSAVTAPTANTVWVSPFAGANCFTQGCGLFNIGPEPLLGSNYVVSQIGNGGFLQADFHTGLAGIPVRGNIGIRYVATHTQVTGYSLSTTTDLNVPVLGQNQTVNTIAPTTQSHNYSDLLPSANIVLEPSEDFLIRVSAAKTIARPPLGSLNPAPTIGVLGNHRVTAGNINLAPFRADNADIALEWYFDKGVLLSLSGFYKDISTFVQNYTSPVSLFNANPFGLPDSAGIAACGTQAGCAVNSLQWTFSYPLNTPGGPLSGVEFAYQQPFTFLPSPFGGLGFVGNYTYVDSRISYLNSAGAVAAVNQLTNLSHVSYNATVYYEDRLLSARISAAYRSRYLTVVPGRNGADVEGTAAAMNVDASATYHFDGNFDVTLEAINLTDQGRDQYFDSSRLLFSRHFTGREFLAGIRYSY
jgi:iron complex outermembrane receptor protein